ncbi:MAG TPA: S8 family serine peptidase [Chitinophagales bacterium]|nr:S8 family serine peptidase [Chitinophagales bacterium]
MRRIKSTLLALFVGLTLFSIAQVHDSLYVDGTLYFKVKDTFSGVMTLQHPAMLQLVPLYQMDTCYRPFMGLNNDTLEQTYCLRFSDTAKMDLCRDTLRTLAMIEYVEKVPLHRTSFVPNDFDGSQWSLLKISAQLAWNISQGSANVVVAIVDNGVLATHEDLAPNMWVNTGEVAGNGFDDDLNGYTDDRNGFDVADRDGNTSPPAGITATDAWNHGTHCAGIASAATNNNKGIASIGFNTKIMAVKCTRNSAESGNELSTTSDGITYAMRNGAKIISMSYGSEGSSVTEQVLMNTASGRGIILVAAAGNDNTTTPFYPASYTNVISVGATDQTDQKASFSNYGPTIDVMAPGVGILSTVASGTTAYSSFSGTSMACPLVAGLAGLVVAANPTFTPAQVEARLKSSADNITLVNPTFTGQLGAGRINAFKALGGTVSSIENETLNAIEVYPNPFTHQLQVNITTGTGSATAEWMDMQGKSLSSLMLHDGENSLQTTEMPQGVYILKIWCNGVSSCRRVIKL